MQFQCPPKLTIADTLGKEIIRERQGIEAIIRAMVLHPNHPDVQKGAVALLQNMAATREQMNPFD